MKVAILTPGGVDRSGTERVIPCLLWLIERLVRGNGLDHRWVGAGDISDNLKSAVIAAEDAKFCTHDGFDYDAIRKAEAYNATHKKKRGASTMAFLNASGVDPVSAAGPASAARW